MSNPRNAGNHVRLTGVLPDVRVTDTRADEAGWSLTGASSDLTADTATLRAENLGWEPFLVDGDAAPGGVVEPRLLGGLGLAAPATLGTSVGGVGSDTLAADVTLAAPVDTRAGTYTGGVAVSLFPQD